MAWSPTPATLAAITAGVVATAVGAGILLQPQKTDPDRTAKGPNVSIAVVTPTEPQVNPGDVMDVGDLADGYTPPRQVSSVVVLPRRPDLAEDEALEIQPRRTETPRDAAPRPAARPAQPPAIVERREPQRRWPFGFDDSGPDYAAARRERQARREEARRFENERRFEAQRERERFDDRREDPYPRDDRDRDPNDRRDDRPRERQWYSSDGRPVPAPERWD